MPPTVSASSRTPQSRRVPKVLIGLVILIGIFVAGRAALSYWVDLLWFRSLGYSQVFWKTYGLQAEIFAAFALLTFLVLYGAFTAMKRIHEADLPRTQSVVVSGRTLDLPLEPVLRITGLCVFFVIACATGASMAEEWPAFALFFHAPAANGVVDPTFGKPLNFFLFTLPVWQLVDGWLLSMSFAAVVMAGIFLLLTAGSRALSKNRNRQAPSPWRGLSLAIAFLLLTFAIRVFVSRYEILFDHHTIFDGATYTDTHVVLTGLLLTCAALILGAAIAVVNVVRGARIAWLAGSIVPAFLCYVIFGIVGWYVSNFIVKPNELVRESPYIANNIRMTRQAFGLDKFQQREFPAETTVDAAEPANNQPTLNNIRLWDWHALQDTLRQVQEIRTYYDFPDIDIDRYQLDGKTREVMLAARELNVEKLPESSRNWINEKLVYTHGYGVTMNPVNGFTPEGLPTLMLSNMPVQSTVPGLAVTRPEIYFGELTNTDVYVKTRQQEFDYPQGQTNSLTSYQGSGGIALGGFLRRVLLAFGRDDLSKLPFSDDVNSESRLLMRRNVRDRVQAIAPFLMFDRDPYLVIGEDGRLSWMLDAFTTSNNYPDSTHYAIGGSALNYMRNSVKAVVDAYDGTTTFYTFDNDDPILAAYRGIFPGLFRDAASMPATLRKHIRYPELLFRMQSSVYGLYHMTDPEVFFNREDLWTVATQNGVNDEGDQAVQAMQPNFVLMKLPGERSEEFVEILPFTPARRNNLIGWIAGRCDGGNYGTAVVYNFPKTRLVDGPQQIEARIDQNAQLSGQLTLWNQQGSHVHRGSLLVIPSGRALLYAEPIYLQAAQSPMPELRLVVLALQDRLAYGPTFEAALASLFGGDAVASGAGDTARTATASPAGAPPSPVDNKALIAEAGRDFSAYEKLTAEGKLAEAGQKLDDLKHILERLNAK